MKNKYKRKKQRRRKEEKEKGSERQEGHQSGSGLLMTEEATACLLEADRMKWKKNGSENRR